MEQKKLIEFRNIVKNFDGQIVLKGVNLDIYEKEFVTLLGPSGCGKTTLLRILGGFLDADEGKVIFDGEVINDKPANKSTPKNNLINLFIISLLIYFQLRLMNHRNLIFLYSMF